MPPIFVAFPPSDGASFLLDGTAVVGYCDFGEYFLSGEDYNILIWSIIDVIIPVRSCVSLFSPS